VIAELRTRWSATPGDVAALVAAAGDALTGPHRDDLLLAWGCLANAPAALAELDRAALVPAGGHARSTGLPAELVDDALQVARMRLVMGDAPKLAAYRGRGALAAFVRTVVVRIAIDLARRDRELPDDHVGAMLDGAHADPELDYMRRQYAATLREALLAAWRALAPHDRFVLGLQLHEKLELDAIAAIYQVHRATAARRTASARAQLIALTRDHIRQALAIGDATVDSILRVVTTSAAWSALAGAQ